MCRKEKKVKTEIFLRIWLNSFPNKADEFHHLTQNRVPLTCPSSVNIFYTLQMTDELCCDDSVVRKPTRVRKVCHWSHNF